MFYLCQSDRREGGCLCQKRRAEWEVTRDEVFKNAAMGRVCHAPELKETPGRERSGRDLVPSHAIVAHCLSESERGKNNRHFTRHRRRLAVGEYCYPGVRVSTRVCIFHSILQVASLQMLLEPLRRITRISHCPESSSASHNYCILSGAHF